MRHRRFSTLKRGVWANNPKPRTALRPIAKKKWEWYERARGWVWLVYADYLEFEEGWRNRIEVLCPKCGRTVLMTDIAADHIENRHDFPQKAKDPRNLQPLCDSCNEVKFEDDHGEDRKRRNTDYRGHKLQLYMHIRVSSDWDEVGLDSFYPDENSGVWIQSKRSGLVAKSYK